MLKGMRKGLVEASGRHASKKQGFFRGDGGTSKKQGEISVNG